MFCRSTLEVSMASEEFLPVPSEGWMMESWMGQTFGTDDRIIFQERIGISMLWKVSKSMCWIFVPELAFFSGDCFGLGSHGIKLAIFHAIWDNMFGVFSQHRGHANARECEHVLVRINQIKSIYTPNLGGLFSISNRGGLISNLQHVHLMKLGEGESIWIHKQIFDSLHPWVYTRIGLYFFELRLSWSWGFCSM